MWRPKVALRSGETVDGLFAPGLSVNPWAKIGRDSEESSRMSVCERAWHFLCIFSVVLSFFLSGSLCYFFFGLYRVLQRSTESHRDTRPKKEPFW